MLGIDSPKDLLQILFSLVTFAIALAAWLRKPGEDAKTALQSHISTEHAGLREKVSTMEERIKHMPTSDELSELEGTVKAIRAQIEAISTSLAAVHSSQKLVETYLLNSKK